MAKKIKCELWVGTQCKYFKLGNHESIAAAKKYIRECRLTCYKEIRRV